MTAALSHPREVLLGAQAAASALPVCDHYSGVEARMNLFKCGDELSHPHFLSWQPIRTEKPDFHRPEFFAQVRFGE